VNNGTLTAQQSSYAVEAEAFNRESGNTLFILDSRFSDGEAINFATNTYEVEWDFTVPYDIPAGDFAIHYRNEGDDTNGTIPATNWYLDGDFIGRTNTVRPLGWNEVYTATGESPPLVEAGQHTVRAENAENGGGGSRFIDVVAPLDDRFSYTFDNTTDANEQLEGPEFFPDSVLLPFTTAETRRNVTEAAFDLTANDVTNSFFVELANDGSTFTRVSNSQTGSVTFASPDRGVDARVSLSRFGTGSTTPTTGRQGQQLSSWQLTLNADAVLPDDINEAQTRAVVPPNTITGETVREAGLKSGSTLLTRHVLAEFTVLADQRLASAETTTFTGTE